MVKTGKINYESSAFILSNGDTAVTSDGDRFRIPREKINRFFTSQNSRFLTNGREIFRQQSWDDTLYPLRENNIFHNGGLYFDAEKRNKNWFLLDLAIFHGKFSLSDSGSLITADGQTFEQGTRRK